MYANGCWFMLVDANGVYAKTGCTQTGAGSCWLMQKRVLVDAVYAKTGCTVGIYTPKGFIKILTDGVERQEDEACKTFGGLAEIERTGGTREAGAFGQRGKRGRL